MSAFLFVIWATGLYALVFNLDNVSVFLRRLSRRLVSGVSGRGVPPAARIRK